MIGVFASVVDSVAAPGNVSVGSVDGISVLSVLLVFIASFFSTVVMTTFVITGLFGFTSALIIAILEEEND